MAPGKLVTFQRCTQVTLSKQDRTESAIRLRHLCQEHDVLETEILKEMRYFSDAEIDTILQSEEEEFWSEVLAALNP